MQACLLAVQRSAGNRAATMLAAGIAAAPVQRSLGVTGGELDRARRGRDRFRAAIRADAYARITRWVRHYERTQDPISRWADAGVLLWACNRWLERHADQHASHTRRQRELVIRVRDAARAQQPIQAARMKTYMDQTGAQAREALAQGWAQDDEERARVRESQRQAQQRYLQLMGQQGPLGLGAGRTAAQNVHFGGEVVKGRGGQEAVRQAAQYGMTAAEVTAVRTYTEGDYRYINPGVANNPEFMEGQRRAIRKEMNEAVPQTKGQTDAQIGAVAPVDIGLSNKELMQQGGAQAAVVMRALAKLPAWSGTLYRGEHYTDKAFRQRYGARGFQEGQTVPGNTFASTSRVRDVGEKFAEWNKRDRDNQEVHILHVLEVDDGRDLQAFSTYQAEKEILLLPGASLQVSRVEYEGLSGRPRLGRSAPIWITVYLRQVA